MSGETPENVDDKNLQQLALDFHSILKPFFIQPRNCLHKNPPQEDPIHLSSSSRLWNWLSNPITQIGALVACLALRTRRFGNGGKMRTKSARPLPITKTVHVFLEEVKRPETKILKKNSTIGWS